MKVRNPWSYLSYLLLQRAYAKADFARALESGNRKMAADSIARQNDVGDVLRVFAVR